MYLACPIKVNRVFGAWTNRIQHDIYGMLTFALNLK